jgi:hypothetical protein
VVDDVSFRRVAVVNFPIYEELCKEQEKYFGMTIKPAERENLKLVMQYILPGIEVQGKYNRGSNSDVAPYMDSLMASFGSVAAHFNEKLELFKDFIPEAEILTINSDWVEVFENLDSHRTMIHMVPQQLGNEGSSAAQPKGAPTMVPMPTAQVAKQAQVQQQHYPQPIQPVVQQPTQSSAGRSFSEMVRSSPHLQQYAYAGMGQPMAPPPGAPRGDWSGRPQGPFPNQYQHGGYGGYHPQYGGYPGMAPRSIV